MLRGNRRGLPEEPARQKERRLQMCRSGPFFTGFLTHSGAMGLRIRQKLSSLGPIFAFDASCRAGSEETRKKRCDIVGHRIMPARAPGVAAGQPV